MKLLLYPYSFEHQFLLISQESFHITGVVVSSKARVNMDFLEKRKIKIHEDLSEETIEEEYDGLFLYPVGFITESFRRILIQSIEKWLKKNKNVFCIIQLTQEEKNLLKIKVGNDIFQKKLILLPSSKKINLQNFSTPFSEVEIPLIYIGQLCENTYAKDLTVGLSMELKKRGYRISTILDDPCAELIKMNETPYFLKEAISEEAKIYYLNNYIRSKEREDRPDIIIAQIPGPALRLSRQTKAGFGIYSFYYSNAFLPDVYFLTGPENLINPEAIIKIDQTMYTSYGYGIDGVWKTNYSIDLEQIIFGECVGTLKKIKSSKDILSSYEKSIQINCGITESIFSDFADIVEELLEGEEMEIY